MQGAGGDHPSNQYGVEAGYTEDYGGASAKMEPLPVDDQGYGTMGSNGNDDNAGNGGAARNPFTQQQYENQKSSNPFK